MTDGRRPTTVTRRARRWLDGVLHGQPVAPFLVSVVATLAVLGLVTVAFPQTGPMAWVVATAPLVVQVLGQLRVGRRRRRDLDRDLSGESLQGADLGGAELPSADLRHRDLSSTRLVGANLAHADLTGATLTDARLHRANLSYTTLQDAGCEGATFYGARLVEARLDGVRAVDVSFERADLRHASLVGSDLRGSSFDGADVRGADFTGAILDELALAGVTSGAATIVGAGRATPIGVRSAQLAAWELVRPVLAGMIGVAAIAGSATDSNIPDEVPTSLFTESAARRPQGDHSVVLSDFGVAAPYLDPDLAASQPGGPLPAGSADPSVAPEPGQASGSGMSVAEAAAAARASEEAQVAVDPGSAGEDLLDEEPTPEVLGLVVERGLHVVVASDGGSSKASFDSPIGATTLVVHEEQRFDFDGAPPGTVTVVLVPEDGAVASCAIAVDGAEDSRRRGLPGEAVTCEVEVGP